MTSVDPAAYRLLAQQLGEENARLRWQVDRLRLELAAGDEDRRRDLDTLIERAGRRRTRRSPAQ